MKQLLIAYALTTAISHGMLDNNGNGVSDVWEHKFDAFDLVADATAKAQDSDGDGMSNLSEAEAGTNPRDASSYHKVNSLTFDGTDIVLGFPTEAGKYYQVFHNKGLETVDWTPFGIAMIGDGEVAEVTVDNLAGDRRFFRVKVTDVDSDLEGLTDWEEAQYAQLDKDSANSVDGANNDLLVLQSIFQNIENNVTVSGSGDAYEKESTTSVFTITSAAAVIYDTKVYFSLSGNEDSTKGSADPSDYNLKDSSGGDLTEKYVVIPAGQSSVDIVLHPVLDQELEVPETLTLNVSGALSSASNRIVDATSAAENNRLFVAQLAPLNGTGSTGSGLASFVLNGSNEFGSINISFFGLSSPQMGAHLQFSENNTVLNLKGLPSGQLSNYPYLLASSQFLNTDQAILDALLAGSLAINIESDNHINGEVKGNLFEANGFTENEFNAPVAAPSINNLQDDDLDRDIIRFLTQATFGPSPESFNALKTEIITTHAGDRMAAYTAYLDNQLGLNGQTAVPSPSLELLIHAMDAQNQYLGLIPGSPDFQADIDPSNRNRRRAWWTLATQAPDEVRQKAAYALSQIFVISEDEGVIDSRHYAMGHYYDMLKEGATGTYRELLENVSKHPCMGQYLSSLRNPKADGIVSPDENYAREIMQLFSIGLTQLNEDGSLKLSSAGLPIATYDQLDISALARVFTGWSLAVYNDPNSSNNVVVNTNFTTGNGNRYYDQRYKAPMINFADFHDVDEKLMTTLGLSIAAGNDGEQDLDITLDFLADHSNSAPFIIRRLIQRLVTSNPSNGYIYRVTQVWKASDGHLGEVIKAILLDYEARTEFASASFGKKREPLVQYVTLLRAVGAKSELPISDLDDTAVANNPLHAHAINPVKYDEFRTEFQTIGSQYPRWANATQYRLGDIRSQLSQMAMGAPSVFNFYFPDYSPSGTLSTNGLRAPEFQITTEVTSVTNINYFHSLLVNSNGQGGSTLPNQDEDPAYNPYNYGQYADHIIPNRDSLTNPFMNAYLSVMDTNGDNKVNELDTTFDQDEHLYAATVALVDLLDLYLAAGQLKKEFAAGFDYQTIRQDNPRDLIIEAVRQQYDYYDDDGDTDPNDGTDNVARDEERQTSVIRERFEYAAYLITISPLGTIQK